MDEELLKKENGNLGDDKLDDIAGGRERADYYTIDCPNCSARMKVYSKVRIGKCMSCGYTYDNYGNLK